ncbi:MAG TPA: hypothetical protein VL899_06600 [Alphaproteobacteria bacterium]|jgi:hypothetical protein|nr:hypothetical protein [Alphaproteobacteria bacterium]
MSSTRNRAAFLAIGLLALAGCSDDPAPTDDTGGLPPGNGICLSVPQIDHTEIMSDKAIIFVMKDGKTYTNTMPIACPSLTMEKGFTYLNDAIEICSNAQTIRVLRSGNYCELGQFTPFQTPKLPADSSKP